MELNQQSTEPRTRSLLRFSRNEVKQALIDFARNAGYKFTDSLEHYFIWFPDKHNCNNGDFTTLGNDVEGKDFGVEHG